MNFSYNLTSLLTNNKCDLLLQVPFSNTVQTFPPYLGSRAYPMRKGGGRVLEEWICVKIPNPIVSTYRYNSILILIDKQKM